MNKVELAKLLGLEIDFMYDSQVFKDNICNYDHETDASFRVGDKYFKVDGFSPDECWIKAANKFLADLVLVATIGYSNNRMWD